MGRSKDVWIEHQHHQAATTASRDNAAVSASRDDAVVMGMVKREMERNAPSSKRSCSPPQTRGSAVAPAALIPPVKSWTFLPARSESGIKSIPVTYQRSPIVLSIQDVLSPFEPSSFVEESTRKTITLRLNKEWDAAVDCFEACILHEAASRSEEFFGRPLGEEEVREMYKPITKKTGEYPRNLRAKLNTSGFYAARYWSADKTRLDARETLSNTPFNVREALRALWIGEDAWGVVADCTDVQLVGLSSEVCPFE